MDQEQLVSLTEQGDLGLGVHPVNDKKEREELQRRLNEMQQQTTQQNNRR